MPGGIPWFAISSISESPITPRRDLGRHERRQGARDAERRRRLDRRHRRRSRRSADARTPTSAACARRRTSPGRAYVSKSGYRFDDFKPYLYRDRRLRRDVDIDRRQSAERADQRHLRGSQESESAVRRQRHRRVRLDRSRRALGEDEQQHAQHAGARSARASARERSGARLVRPRFLDHEHLAAAGADARPCSPKTCTCSRSSPTVQRITWSFGANDYLFGQRHLQTPNETERHGDPLLPEEPGRGARPRSSSPTPAGREVAKLQGASTPGINTVVWTMRPQAEGRGGRGGGRGANPLESLAPLGDYTVTLQVGETKLTAAGEDHQDAGLVARAVADDYQAVILAAHRVADSPWARTRARLGARARGSAKTNGNPSARLPMTSGASDASAEQAVGWGPRQTDKCRPNP